MNNILMTAPVVLSTQQEIKTQTRRIDKRLPSSDVEVKTQISEDGRCFVFFDGKCLPLKYRIGEVLWVREPATVVGTYGDNGIDSFKAQYISDGKVSNFISAERFLKDEELPEWITYCEGIPNGCIREMARTFIRITNIRVERLNEISEDDAIAEGIKHLGGGQIADTGDCFETYYYHGDLIDAPNDGWGYENTLFEWAYDALVIFGNQSTAKTLSITDGLQYMSMN
jgi:hypothetical protein